MTELETKTEKEISRRKFLGKLGMGLAGLALVRLSTGCAEGVSEENPQRITLKVNGQYEFFLRYAGMPNKETFSLTGTGRTSVNFYYPAEAEIICYGNKEFKVIEVTPEYITLDKIAESCK